MNLKLGYFESQCFSNNQWRIIENMLDHLEDKRQSQSAFGLALGVVFLGLVYSEILVCLVSFYLLTFLKKNSQSAASDTFLLCGILSHATKQIT